jgi:transcriptional regulator with XRE-family HTH domain
MEGGDFTRLKLLRVARGLTQSQLADMIGVTQGTVSQWEKGMTHPRFGVIPRLATALGVSVDDIIGKIAR